MLECLGLKFCWQGANTFVELLIKIRAELLAKIKHFLVWIVSIWWIDDNTHLLHWSNSTDIRHDGTRNRTWVVSATIRRPNQHSNATSMLAARNPFCFHVNLNHSNSKWYDRHAAKHFIKSFSWSAGYSSVGRASDCSLKQQSDGPWFDSGWPDFYSSCNNLLNNN